MLRNRSQKKDTCTSPETDNDQVNVNVNVNVAPSKYLSSSSKFNRYNCVYCGFQKSTRRPCLLFTVIAILVAFSFSFSHWHNNGHDRSNDELSIGMFQEFQQLLRVRKKVKGAGIDKEYRHQQQQRQVEKEQVEEEEQGEQDAYSTAEEAQLETETETTSTVTAVTPMYSSSSSSKYAIFYNTFAAVNNTQQAHNTISSQLKIINDQALLDGAPLYYTRIGEDLDSWAWPKSDCVGISNERGNAKKRECVEIIATEEGDEVLTLQPLYEYCKEHPEHKVIYMHSKGAYTANTANNQLRTVLMWAINSDECLNMPTGADGDGDGDGDSDSRGSNCDACSSQFAITPFLSYIGNMFVASCSYVSKLLPPKEFGVRKKEIVDYMLTNLTKKVQVEGMNVNNANVSWYETKLDDDETTTKSYTFNHVSMSFLQRESWLGMGRYGSEHWIASHPNFRPCEVYEDTNNPKIKYGETMLMRKFQLPKLVKIQESMTKERAYDYWRKNRDHIINPYYGTYGRLYEYKKLYGKVPPEDSWFYTLWNEFEEFNHWHAFD